MNSPLLKMAFFIPFIWTIIFQMGCTTREQAARVRFHYYEVGDEIKEIIPANVKIYTFNGLQLPFYPTNFLRREASSMEFPMLSANEIYISDLPNESEMRGFKSCTFISFDKYYPIDLTPLFIQLQVDELKSCIGKYEWNKNQKEVYREVYHILIPLFPKDVQSLEMLAIKDTPISLLFKGRRYPFLSAGKCYTARGLISSLLGLYSFATPDIIPLNRYYNECVDDALCAINIAYPKIDINTKE